jgi:hypothetical protein
MKLVAIFIATMFVFCGCNKTDSSQLLLKSEIKAVTSHNTESKVICESLKESQLLFTGNDIAWFNPNSREIKFTNIQPGPFSIPMYAQIDMKIKDETLFTIVAHIINSVSRAYDDLVLFYDLETSKYYLYDNYPNYWSPESTQKNIEKRDSGWNKFLVQLKKEGRLKE